MMYSIVVPVYNSERMLPELHRRLVRVFEQLSEPFEMVFVDDCGPGNAWGVLRELAEQDTRVVALQLMRNSGQGSATLAGIAQTRGEFVITLDDDLQHPPEEIPTLIEKLRENGDLDVVIGAPREKRHHIVRRMGSSFINRMNSVFLDKDPALRFTGFRIIRRQVADALVDMQVPYPALGPMIISITRRIENVIVQHDPRKEGRSGYTFRRMIKQTLSNFVGYSMLPLRMLAFFGSIGILASVVGGIYFLTRYFVVGIGVPGWTTLLLILLALSSFNFFAFAVLGEYLLRITQVSTRTYRYNVRETVTRAYSEKTDTIDTGA
jgi:glycosyltransferase involved in cell wall biosynthesis